MAQLPAELPDIEISYSPWRLRGLAAVGVLTSLCAYIAFYVPGNSIGAVFHIAVGYFGFFFFGFATCKSFWLLWSSRKLVVFINRDGIRDTRISSALIAWSQVEGISIWQAHRQKLVLLKVTPLAAERLDLTALQRILGPMNKAVGADGLAINSVGLTMDADTLFEICERYKAAVRS